jgi:hypothetical protein
MAPQLQTAAIARAALAPEYTALAAEATSTTQACVSH